MSKIVNDLSSLLFFIVYIDHFIYISYITVFICVAKRGSSNENTELRGAEVVNDAFKRVWVSTSRARVVV